MSVKLDQLAFDYSEGCNVMFIFYGQTGTGKSTCMESILSSIVDRSIHEEKEVIMTSIELYKDAVFDLLKSNNRSKISLSDAKHSEKVTGRGRLDQLLALIDQRRIIRPNGTNDKSSRGHVIIDLAIADRSFRIVDCAGREIIDNKWGEELTQEAKFINPSLNSLTDLLNNCRKDEKFHGVVNILTKALESPLKNPKWRTVLVATLSSKLDDRLKSIQTLDFLFKKYEKDVKKRLTQSLPK